MATESFYEDMVIDTHEAMRNLKALAEEEPHLMVNDEIRIEHADDEFMDLVMEKYRKKD